MWSAASFPTRREMVRGSERVQLAPELNRQPHEPLIEKPRASAFFATNLLALLIAARVDTVIVTGAAPAAAFEARARAPTITISTSSCRPKRSATEAPRRTRPTSSTSTRATRTWLRCKTCKATFCRSPPRKRAAASLRAPRASTAERERRGSAA